MVRVRVVPYEPNPAGLHFDSITNLTNEEFAVLESIEPECDTVMELFALFNTEHWLTIGLRADQICDFWEEKRGGEVAEDIKEEMMDMCEWERARLVEFGKAIRKRKARQRKRKRQRQGRSTAGDDGVGEDD